jgi:hypothetical protein
MLWPLGKYLKLDVAQLFEHEQPWSTTFKLEYANSYGSTQNC